MQSHYAQAFERDMGCTEADWLRWLPAAIGPHPHTQGAAMCRVTLDALQSGASLCVSWQVLPSRVIALARIPRLQVRFVFAGLDDGQRLAFMKRFDLYMHRGGG